MKIPFCLVVIFINMNAAIHALTDLSLSANISASASITCALVLTALLARTEPL